MIWPLLSIGSVDPEIGNLQRFLNTAGFRDSGDLELRVDEHFGVRTKDALIKYKRHLAPVFGAPTRARAIADGFVPFIQARHFFRRWKPPELVEIDSARREIRQIVVHTMESSEKPGTAENVARWFANEHAPKFPAPRASAHYNIDPDFTIQSVRAEDVAWGSPGRYTDGAYVNDHCLHIEHAGKANQSEADWADPISSQILWRSARLVKVLATRYCVPVTWIDAVALKAGERGITGHGDLSKAFGGSHWDPGPHFPHTRYLELVRASDPFPSPESPS